MWPYLVLTLISLGNADKLNRLYLPPANAQFAGGQPGDIEIPNLISPLQNGNNPSNNLDGVIPNDKFINFNSSTVLPSMYNGFTNPITDLMLSKPGLIPKTDQQYNERVDGSSTEPFEKQSSFYPGNVSGNGVNYNTNTQPEFSKNIQFDKIQPSFNKDILQNLDDTLTSNVQPNFLNLMSSPQNLTRNLIPSPKFQVNSIDFNINDVKPTYYRDRLIANTNQYPERSQADADRNAVILKYDNTLTPDGYAYSFDTSNGIHGDENGTIVDGGTKAQGSYSYIGDDGNIYSVTYTADENGFQPRASHIPTAPPIPEAILQALERIAENEKNGIFDDGSYDDNKYGYKTYDKFHMDGPLSNRIKSVTRPISILNDNYYGVTTESIPIHNQFVTTTGTLNPYNYDAISNNDEFKLSKQPGNTKFEDILINNPYRNGDNIDSDSDDKIPHMTRDENSINTPNSIKFQMLQKMYPLFQNQDKQSDDYEIRKPDSQTGYQYFPPINKFISQSNTLFDISPKLSEARASTFKPFDISKIPQNSNTGYKNQDKLSRLRNNDDVVTLSFEKPYNTYQKLPNLKVSDSRDFDSNPEEKEYNRPQYIINRNEEIHLEEPKQKSNLDLLFYTTTPISSQYPTNTVTYSTKRIENPINKLTYYTTSLPDAFLNLVRNKTDDRPTPYSILDKETNPDTDDQTKIKNEPVYETKDVNKPEFIDTIKNDYTLTPDYKPIPNNQRSSDELNRSQPLGKIIGEDFRGPKQPQRYDAKTGYHY